jgi:hypothetical protein
LSFTPRHLVDLERGRRDDSWSSRCWTNVSMFSRCTFECPAVQMWHRPPNGGADFLAALVAKNGADFRTDIFVQESSPA